MGYQMRVREIGLPLVLQLLLEIHTISTDTVPSDSNYVDLSDTEERIVVFSNVPPSCISKFLVTFLLTKGSYRCEFDLFSKHSHREAYQTAGLLSEASEIRNDDILALN